MLWVELENRSNDGRLGVEKFVLVTSIQKFDCKHSHHQGIIAIQVEDNLFAKHSLALPRRYIPTVQESRVLDRSGHAIVAEGRTPWYGLHAMSLHVGYIVASCCGDPVGVFLALLGYGTP